MDVENDSLVYRFEPSQEVVERALNEIRENEESIDILDGQIGRLRAEIRVLENRKRHHMFAISRNRGLLTLARRMPGEILSRIFSNCVEDGWTRAPVVVSQVCSAWREAAMAPVVWSSIYVDCDKGDPIARCHLWLERSQQCHLDITLRLSEQRAVADAVLDVLLEHRDRWRSLTVEAQSVRDANSLLLQCASAGPSLSELSLEVANDERIPLDIVGEELWNFRLVDCSTLLGGINNSLRLSITSNFPSTWRGMTNITVLNLQLHLCTSEHALPLFATDVVLALTESPSLQHLSITVPRRDVRPLRVDISTPHIALQELKTLEISTPPAYMMLLRHIIAPSLDSLVLRTPDDFHGFATENVRETMRVFVTRNSSNLRLLELYDIDVAQDDFLAMFSSLENIEEIRLHGSEILDETVEALYASREPILCPRLSRLDFRWCGHLSGSTLVRLVESRASADEAQCVSLAAITMLRVINCSFVKEKDILAIANNCTCFLKMREEFDFCRKRGCCDNVRYRHRFESRHARSFTSLQATRVIF